MISQQTTSLEANLSASPHDRRPSASPSLSSSSSSVHDGRPASGSSVTKVLCVDDNFLVAQAIGINLQQAGGFQWLGQLADADQLVEEARRLRPDVVLLDIDMPGRDPFSALQDLSEACPDVRVLMFSGHAHEDLIDRAIDAGAWGYLLKSETTATIIDAIRRVARGEFVLGAIPQVGA